MPSADDQRTELLPGFASQPAGPPPEVREGDVLGQYRLLDRLGSGGMGQVFRALHPTMDRVVAVKVMAPQLVEDARARARFLREVRSAARLAHPNIVMAYDASEDNGRCFLVMEYVEGKDAADLLREAGLPSVPLACEIIRQAALGLQHAHEQGMVHRDIKPSNLVIAARRPAVAPSLPSGVVRHDAHTAVWPAEPVVKILDFGLARLQTPAGADAPPAPGHTPLTREGCVVGTPEFMSPEQACDSARTDIRSDLYSLGCTFYCLLTGHPPFRAKTFAEVMVSHLQHTPDPVTRRRPDVPSGLAAVVARMLAKPPEDRYQTPAEVADALAPWAAAASRGAVGTPASGPAVLPASTEQPPGGPTEVFRPAVVPATRTPRSAALPAAGSARGAADNAARAVFGCLGLFLILILSMIVGWVYLLPTAPPEQAPPEDDTHLVKSVGLTLVPLPGGPFKPSYAAARELLIPHNFEVSATEVTREQFRLFAEGDGYRTVAELGRAAEGGAAVLQGDGSVRHLPGASWSSQPRDASPDTPVVCVAWEDALAFCNWLSRREGLRPCYRRRDGGEWECDFRADGFRLPTEAEWEYAARAGAPTLYPGPEAELVLHGWFHGETGGPQPVRKKKANQRGLYDVWGNVWEWCWDWYDDLPGPFIDYTGPSARTGRVARGGGWNDLPEPEKGGMRKGLPANYCATDLGFRVVRTAP